MTNEQNEEVPMYECPMCHEYVDSNRIGYHHWKECPESTQAVIDTRLTLLEKTGTSRPTLKDLVK